MMGYIARKLTHLLNKYVPMTDDEFEVYQYAFDIALYTIISTTGLIFVGLLCNQIVPTLICISLFYLNQSFGGGYHASTHLGCFLTMMFGLLVYLGLNCMPYRLSINLGCGGLSLIVLFAKPLVLHKNKRYLEKQRSLLERRSRMKIILEVCVYVAIIYSQQKQLISSFSWSMVICAFSRIVAWKRSATDA